MYQESLELTKLLRVKDLSNVIHYCGVDGIFGAQEIVRAKVRENGLLEIYVNCFETITSKGSLMQYRLSPARRRFCWTRRCKTVGQSSIAAPAGCALRFALSKPFPAEYALSLGSLVCGGLISRRVSRKASGAYLARLGITVNRNEAGGRVPIEIIIRLKVCFHREMGFWRCTLWNPSRLCALLRPALTELRGERKVLHFDTIVRLNRHFNASRGRLACESS